jgi:hypothetical protein
VTSIILLKELTEWDQTKGKEFMENFKLKITKEMIGKCITTTKDYIVYKKVGGGIAQLLIPAGARIVVPHDYNRTGMLSSRKLRADKAVCLMIVPYTYSEKYKAIDKSFYVSRHDYSFTYKIGKKLKPKLDFSSDVINACRSGIHFFTSIRDAERY